MHVARGPPSIQTGGGGGAVAAAVAVAAAAAAAPVRRLMPVGRVVSAQLMHELSPATTAIAPPPGPAASGAPGHTVTSLSLPACLCSSLPVGGARLQAPPRCRGLVPTLASNGLALPRLANVGGRYAVSHHQASTRWYANRFPLWQRG